MTIETIALKLLLPIAPALLHGRKHSELLPLTDQLCAAIERVTRAHLPDGASLLQCSSEAVPWEDAGDVRRTLGKKSPADFWRPILVLADLKIALKLHEDAPLELRDADLQAIAVDEAISTAKRVAADLVLSACICRPELVQPLDSFVMLSGRAQKLLSPTSLQEPADYAQRYEWPPIRALEVDAVWSWLAKLDGFVEGMGKGPVGRASAALSYLVVQRCEPELEMLWALLGLEALYGRGIYNLQAQILEKSEIFLGPRTKHKKVFREIYSFRSRFVHGDLDVPFSECDYYGIESHTRYQDATGSTSQLAAAVLLSSIQELIHRNRHDLEFAYEIVEKPA